MENIFNLNFCIWGTGRYCKILIRDIGEYTSLCKMLFHKDIFDNVKYFIDTDIEKQGRELYGKCIKSLLDFMRDDFKFCVIALSKKEEISAILEENGLKRNINYTTSKELVNKYKEEILRRRNEIFASVGLDFLLKIDTLDYYKALLLVKSALNNIKENDKILKYVIFTVLIDCWCKSADKNIDFRTLRENFDDTFIVAAFAWYYGEDIAEIADWFGKNTNHDFAGINSKQTIGLVADRYFGGGIEKVVSLLLPLYVKNGHKVVLITDDYNSKAEYDIPKEVIRHVMSYSIEDNVEDRLSELSKCVAENHIDIICFHFGYTRISTFYEMLRLRLQHIAVLMEVHSAFLPLIKDHKDVSKLYASMYKMADRLIVLSDVDKLFWENLGCNCTYIQNPVEDSYERNRIKKYNCPIIVWVGRLVQTPKRVLDTIPIMKEVVKVVPYAKLQIVGAADEQWVYHSLVRQIEENNLKSNIELYGYKSDIDEIYREADIVLMTSSSESFCNVIMESKVRGIPIVMYELPGLELLKDGNGYVAVEQGNTSAAAEAIVDMLNDDEMRKRISVESRKSIEPFIYHDVYADWKQVFDDIINGKSREVSVCSEFAIIEKMLLDAVYDK